MFSICRLRRRSYIVIVSYGSLSSYRRRPGFSDVQSFLLVHLVTKIGTATNDAATSLKLLEKGLSKEDLSLAVLVDFPFQIVFGWLAARWSSGKQPLSPVGVCDPGFPHR